MKEIIVLVGYPSSGKSTTVKGTPLYDQIANLFSVDTSGKDSGK